jgi:hypothetical protein
MIATTLAVALCLASGPDRAAQKRQPAPVETVAAPSRSEAEERALIEAWLGAIDTRVSAARWRSLGPAARPILRAVAADERRLPTRRAKAVGALVAFGEVGDRPAFEGLTFDERAPLVVRLAAVRALAAGTPDAELPAVMGSVVERAVDLQVRAHAALSLVRRLPAACGALELRLRSEGRASREGFGAALQTCGLPEQ